MTTIRQIERNWSSKKYERLFRELMATRPEAAFCSDMECGAVAAAAMVIIRLDELSQSYASVYGQLVRTLVAAQEADGGWGDLMITALCVRALLCGQGGGPAVERGIAYLGNLQKSDGIWPKIPLRRMPEDALTSAFVLYQLGDQLAFQLGVRFADALEWFVKHDAQLDAESGHLWDRASLRCRLGSSASVSSAADSPRGQIEVLPRVA